MPYYTVNIRERLKKTFERIEKAIYQPVADLKVTAWVTPEPVSFSERTTGERKELKVGESWGKLWDCAWFNFTGQIPQECKGKKVVLLIDLSGEGCVFDEKGNPVQGLTTASSHFDRSQGRPDKRVVVISECWDGKGDIDIWVDAGCNDLFGNYRDSGTLKEACIAVCNENMRKLYYDFEVLYELMEYTPEDKARHFSILYALNDAANLLKEYSDQEAEKAREVLAAELNKKCGDMSLSVSAIGHAHIDLGWLWPIRETIRKGARTFSTVLMNMERYPDYVFGASQPQLYQWMKDYYPGLYERIKQRVAEGRWEAQGAMWVEADTNISGGEALVRQVLYGKRFFREEFGKDMKILWLPDVFGYNAALPQIMKKSGVDYFMTQKLSWSKYDVYPHHTFWWKGLDGSTVLVHMHPEASYNSPASPKAIIRSERVFLDKGISDKVLVLFGVGDGGGGPGEEHLERLAREKNLEGLIPVTQEPALDFFRHIEKDGHKYKTWQGELYLEFHQGTFTSQARNKRYNRKMEFALRELEFASVLAMLTAGKAYPQEELESIWKEVLLYQFHDILPGSSIGRVYSESLERYRILMDRVQCMINEAYSSIAEGVCKKSVCIFNSLSWKRSEWINIGGKWVKVDVEPMGCAFVDMSDEAQLTRVPSCDETQALSCSENQLENDLLRVRFDDDGTIVSVYDKQHDREAIAEGSKANRLAVYEDYGDAWDFSIQYDETPGESFELTGTKSYIEGPKAIRESTYRYGNSVLKQKVILTAGSRRIDFVTTVDWKENHRMLRTSFPVNVYATEATCEIQFGNIKRPLHRNTTWDMAKYEVPAHKWVDISQGDYGVSLMNDCKYGHKVVGNVMDLNLLRSPRFPDDTADRAVHEFTYSLYPHSGDYVKGGVVRAGYELNIPLTVIDLPEASDNDVSCFDKTETLKCPEESVSGYVRGNCMKSLIEVDAENVIVEAVKKAEDSNAIIVRLYECHGAGANAKIKVGFEYSQANLVNLLEEPIEETALDKENLVLKFKPFEIQTLKFTLNN